MAAYLIVEIEILDPAGYEEYEKLAGRARVPLTFATKPIASRRDFRPY
jgi:uncharacterized protein (DUF1330 family)